MTEIAALVTQIARAKRFAAAMTNDAEKDRFTILAEELEGELLRCQSILDASFQTPTTSL